MPQDASPKAHSYQRWSTILQSHGSSEFRQSSSLKAFLKKHKLTLADTILDAGRSAFRGKHKEGNLKTFLDSVESGSIPSGSWLCIDDVSRLSRLPLDAGQELFRKILRAGITIGITSTDKVIKPEHKDDLGASLELMVAINAAHYESQRKQERALGAWESRRKKLENGQSVGIIPGICPAWLDKDRDNNCYIINEPKAAIVRRIFQMYLDGTGGYSIASQLNKEGVECITRAKQWCSGTVNSLLRNEAVIGQYSPSTTIYHDDGKREFSPKIGTYIVYPPILEKDIFDRVQAVRNGRGVSISKGKSPFRSILQGIGKCICGSNIRIVVNGGGKYNYYLALCENYGHKCKGRKSVPVKDVEAYLFDMLVSEQVVTSLLENSKSSDNTINIQAAEGRLLEAQRKVDDLSEYLAENISNKAIQKAITPKLTAAQNALEATEKELNTLRGADAKRGSTSLTEDYTAIFDCFADPSKPSRYVNIKAGDHAVSINQLLKRHFSKIVWDAQKKILTLHLIYSGKIIQKDYSDNKVFSMNRIEMNRVLKVIRGEMERPTKESANRVLTKWLEEMGIE